MSHARAGLLLLLMLACSVHAATRAYYVAVDEVTWDYAPLNRNGVTGAPFNDTNGGMSSMMESEATWVLNATKR